MPGIDPFDLDQLRGLAKLLEDADLTEIEIAIGENRIRLARQMPLPAMPAFVAPQTFAPPQATGQSAGPAPATTAEAVHQGAIVSPMVGTVYVAPEPGAAPFVQVGDTVEEGQTVLIVEAMKTMNPIQALRRGRVIRILVSDAQPVEFGEPLLIIE